jgi:iron(III) transport system substrate-binding protein
MTEEEAVHFRNRSSSCLALAALCTLLAACGSSSSSSSSKAAGSSTAPATTAAAATPAALGGQANYSALESLYKQAEAAGQHSVVIYGPSAGTDTPLYDAFHKDFPDVTVTGVPVVGPPMTAKLSAEVGSGKHVASIAYTGNTDMLAYAAQGWLTPFKPPTLPPTSQLPPETLGPGNAFVGTSFAVPGTIYNTTEVPASKVPKTWQALLDPRWKGKMAMYDPTAVGEMADVFAHLDASSQYAQIMAGLHAQNVQLTPATNITGPLTAVASGAKQIGIAVPFAFYLGAKKSGAPLGFTLLDAGNYTVTLYMGLLKGAPDPIASRLYESWLFTPQAASVIAAEGAYSALPNSPSPGGLPPYSQINFLKPIPFSDVERADNGAIQASKKYWG